MVISPKDIPTILEILEKKKKEAEKDRHATSVSQHVEEADITNVTPQVMAVGAEADGISAPHFTQFETAVHTNPETSQETEDVSEVQVPDVENTSNGYKIPAYIRFAKLIGIKGGVILIAGVIMAGASLVAYTGKSGRVGAKSSKSAAIVMDLGVGGGNQKTIQTIVTSSVKEPSLSKGVLAVEELPGMASGQKSSRAGALGDGAKVASKRSVADRPSKKRIGDSVKVLSSRPQKYVLDNRDNAPSSNNSQLREQPNVSDIDSIISRLRNAEKL